MDIKAICLKILNTGKFGLTLNSYTLNGDHSFHYFKKNDEYSHGGYRTIEILYSAYRIWFDSQYSDYSLYKSGRLFYTDKIEKQDVEEIVGLFIAKEKEHDILIKKEFEELIQAL